MIKMNLRLFGKMEENAVNVNEYLSQVGTNI